MIILSAAETAEALPRNALVERLRLVFQQEVEAPLRHHHTIKIPDENDASLLMMPAWQVGGYLGIKNVMVIPDNHRRGKASVAASYMLYSAISGELLAVMDGEELTNRRTAAASALASDYLSRSDSSKLLMIGAGGLAPHLIAAHCAVRPINEVTIWARDTKKASELANSLRIKNVRFVSAENLKAACLNADIISCATLSKQPLVQGEFVCQGTHVDLVGAFTRSMRESDDRLISKATLFADTYDGALNEAGDYAIPIESGLISEDDIEADLRSLCLGQHNGRQDRHERTVFKSTGTALEDLAAATLAYEKSKN